MNFYDIPRLNLLLSTDVIQLGIAIFQKLAIKVGEHSPYKPHKGNPYFRCEIQTLISSIGTMTNHHASNLDARVGRLPHTNQFETSCLLWYQCHRTWEHHTSKVSHWSWTTQAYINHANETHTFDVEFKLP